MALQDVSDNLDDPDFASTFDVFRAVESVSDKGRASATAISDPLDKGVRGVVVPAGSLELQRLADGERNRGAINIWTRYRLSDGKGAEEAHIVVWSNNHYVVVAVDDYTAFGSGFVKATADLYDIQNA